MEELPGVKYDLFFQEKQDPANAPHRLTLHICLRNCEREVSVKEGQKAKSKSKTENYLLLNILES